MPRYYAEKIYKREKRVSELLPSSPSKAKIVVSSALSRALAYRAQMLAFDRYLEALQSIQADSYKQNQSFRCSEISTLVSRDFKAKQSLLTWYSKNARGYV